MQFKNYFYDIYNLAKEQNGEALLELLAHYTPCIDEFEPGTVVSAVEKLASEGFKDEAIFLVSYGANKTYAARGAAFRNSLYMEDIEYFLSQGCSINAIVEGYAMGCHLTEIRLLKSIYKNKIKDKYVEFGAIYGGKREFFSPFELKKMDKNSLTQAAQFFILNGNFEYAESLGTYGAHPEGIAFTFAIKKNTKFLEIHKNSVVQGLAFGGHAEEILSMDLSDVNLSEIAARAAMGGHYSFAEHLRKTFNIPLDTLIKGAVKGCHVRYVDYLKSLLAKETHDNPVAIPIQPQVKYNLGNSDHSIFKVPLSSKGQGVLSIRMNP